LEEESDEVEKEMQMLDQILLNEPGPQDTAERDTRPNTEANLQRAQDEPVVKSRGGRPGSQSLLNRLTKSEKTLPKRSRKGTDRLDQSDIGADTSKIEVHQSSLEEVESANLLFNNLRELMSQSVQIRNDSPELYDNIRHNYMKLLDMGVKTGMLPDFAENYVNQSFARNYKDNKKDRYGTENRRNNRSPQSASSLEQRSVDK